ncbi:MAG TPA: tetratricopeptide repeat protein, partial [Anaerolineaceae bacterium]|nr:tetratricopeptide repeat protein [Anaerolineaceae bacterium]
LAICIKIGDRDGQAIALSNMGEAAAAGGRWSQAVEFYRQGLALARLTQDVLSLTTCLINLGQAQTHLGQLVSARSLLVEGLRAAQSSQLAVKVVQAVLALGEWLEKNGQTGKAGELAQAVKQHPACEEDHLRAANELLARGAPAEETTPQRDLDELVPQILAGDYLAG